MYYDENWELFVLGRFPLLTQSLSLFPLSSCILSFLGLERRNAVRGTGVDDFLRFFTQGRVLKASTIFVSWLLSFLCNVSFPFYLCLNSQLGIGVTAEMSWTAQNGYAPAWAGGRKGLADSGIAKWQMSWMGINHVGQRCLQTFIKVKSIVLGSSWSSGWTRESPPRC